MAAPVPKEADASKASKASNSNENITVRPDSPLSNGINPTPSKVSTTSMVGLARIITRETEKLETYLNESRIPMPGFDVDAPANFPKLPNEMKKAREEIVRANQLLTDLVTGPMEHLRWMAWDVRLPPLTIIKATTHGFKTTTTLSLSTQSTTIKLVPQPLRNEASTDSPKLNPSSQAPQPPSLISPPRLASTNPTPAVSFATQ